MKFYIYHISEINPREHHIIFSIDHSYLLINLSDKEFKENILYTDYQYTNFKNWCLIHEDYIPFFEFLTLKHTFEITRKVRGNELGINSFELSDFHLM